MSSHDQTPHVNVLSSMKDILLDGYLFIQNKTDNHHSDFFETSLFGKKVVFITGKEAAKIFYDPDKFSRYKVLPKRIQKTLFGENTVHGKDGETHLHRKHLFMSLMSPPQAKRIVELVTDNWQAALSKWEKSDNIILLDEAKYVLCKAACHWAGVPLAESEVEIRTKDFYALLDATSAVGPRHWKGRKARIKTENWLSGLIEDVRADKLKAKQDSPLYAIAFHKELDGKLLDTKMAAIELINTIRPTIAISIYISFLALALHDYPKYKEFLLKGKNDDFEMFVQEVRRFYPFAPFIGAKVRKQFTWNQYQFEEGILVLLDVYGTNHDSEIWNNPYEFRPERFKDWNKNNLFDFIPQGGGDPAKGHRCPGEIITVEIMKATLDFLVKKIDYDLPSQDLSYSLSKMPTFPKSGIIINNVKRKQV